MTKPTEVQDGSVEEEILDDDPVVSVTTPPTTVVDGEVLDDEPEDDEGESEEPEGDDDAEGEASPEDESEDSEELTKDDEDGSATPPEEEEVAETLDLRADGVAFSVPARVSGDTITMTRDEFQRHIQPRLADRAAWQREREATNRQIAALSPEKNPEVIRARALLDRLSKVLESNESLTRFTDNFETEKGRLMAEVDAAAAKAEAEALRAGQATRATEEQTSQLLSQLDQGLEVAIATFAQRPEFSGVDVASMKGELLPFKRSLFFVAQEGDGSGVNPGEIGIRLDLISQAMQRRAQVKKAKGEYDSAKRRNTKATKRTKAPPVGAGRGRGGSGKGSESILEKPAQTREEYEKKLRHLSRGAT